MKKMGFLTLLITAMFLLVLAFPAAATSPKAAAAPVASAPASPAVAPAPMPPHPHIGEALEAMRNAKHHLEAAEPEFHGHRKRAIEHLDQAIHEAEECMREP